ncbi:hypothetical protein RAJCM14343_1689 [Rhodococcus aetherivorans]|uniref:Uncharacterized protein n=1 Tax=Rhodococcus aetherivorans TaxID=191292 RepID=A0ABQ0YIR3_9NOCA|nr:hypothetical protein RAJCM14343_1689 [Rhodococcus aetherivorans]
MGRAQPRGRTPLWSPAALDHALGAATDRIGWVQFEARCPE